MQCAYAKAGIQRVRQFPSQNVAAMPIDHGREIQKTALQPYVRYVRAPDLVHSIGDQAAKKIWKDPVLLVWHRESRPRVDDLQ